MNCERALELMLDAEPSEMTAGAAGPLGAHLGRCGKCQRVGSQLLADTRLLTVELALPVARKRTRTLDYAPAAFAASILVMLTLQLPDRNIPVPRVLPTVVVSGGVPSAAEVLLSPVALPSPRELSSPRKRGSSDLVRRAFPVAQAIATVPLAFPAPVATPQTVVESNAVSVTPPAGTRAVVMHTSDPKLVVVWLYDPEDSR